MLKNSRIKISKTFFKASEIICALVFDFISQLYITTKQKIIETLRKLFQDIYFEGLIIIYSCA